MQFSQGEIQQLQEFLREEIHQLTHENMAYVSNARYFSKRGEKDLAGNCYVTAEKIQQKINKLAELQRKLKRTKLSLVEVDTWFDENSDDDMEM